VLHFLLSPVSETDTHKQAQLRALRVGEGTGGAKGKGKKGQGKEETHSIYNASHASDPLAWPRYTLYLFSDQDSSPSRWAKILSTLPMLLGHKHVRPARELLRGSHCIRHLTWGSGKGTCVYLTHPLYTTTMYLTHSNHSFYITTMY
jgi:hypothetical protein